MPHPWPVFTPEDNHTTLTRLGTGPATTLAYHAALTAQIVSLESITATSAASAASTYGPAWQGVGSVASAASQTGLNAAGAAMIGWLSEKLPLVAAVVSGWQAAAAAMVPTEACVGNRTEEAIDEQINPWVWGALTPRIADLNLEYFGHMWPRNAAAGAAYGATARASAVAMLAIPPPPAITGGSAAAPAAAAATIAEDAGTSTAGATLRAGAQAAEAVISPTTGAPQTLSRAAARVPAAAVPAAHPLGVLGRPAMSQSAVGMFAPVSAAAVAAPAAETAAASEAGPLTGTPRGAPGAGYPGAGLTSYLRPADGFTTPPAGGRPVSAPPGMLNAAALRGGSLTTTHPSAPGQAQSLGFEPGRTPLAPMPLAPTTTAPSPTPSQPPKSDPDSDMADIAKLHREVDDFQRRWTDFERRVAAHNRKPTEYDMNDPVQRQAFDQYQREEKALLAEETRLVRERNDLREKVLESGLTIVNGEVQWPGATTTTTPHR